MRYSMNANRHNKVAPVILFVYNRPWHTQQTIEALRQNESASETELFIYADGPKKPAHTDALREVRQYIRSVDGFKSVTLVERYENFGLARSVITGVTEIVNRHGRAIVLEDDLITSPYFLRFMNDALEFYQNEERVISIHGYVYPIKARLPETFMIKDTGCWGWATWKRGWDLFDPDGKKLLQEIERKRLTKKFDINGSYFFTKMLRDQTKGINNSWAIRWQASAFLQDRLTLFPGISLVKNIGNDNSGVHSAATSCFDVELATSPVAVQAIPVEDNLYVLKELERYFNSINPPLPLAVFNKLKTLTANAFRRTKLR
jgi:hypothetical protein